MLPGRLSELGERNACDVVIVGAGPTGLMLAYAVNAPVDITVC